MAKNKTILQKADLAVADLIASGGYLQPEQSKQFIKLLIDEAVVMKYVTVKPMKSPQALVEGIILDSRILRPGVSAQALPASDRTKPTTTKLSLTSTLVKAQINLDEETLEDNIEQGTLKDTIMSLMAERIALDLDELIVQGDTSSSDAFLALMDGWLASVTTNTVDAGITTLSDAHLKAALKTIPSAALRNRNKVNFFTSVDAELDYADQQAARATPGGDTYHDTDKMTSYRGFPIIPVAMFPENLGAGSNETRVILMDAKNWVHGIQRKIKLASQEDIEDGVLKIVATLRIAGGFTYEPYTCQITKVKVG